MSIRGPGGRGRAARSQIDASTYRLRVLSATAGQPAAMASPPTATLGANSAATAIPTATTTRNWDSTAFLRTAGAWKQFGGSFPDTLGGRGQTTTYLSGTSDVGFAYALEVIFTGRYFEPQVLCKGMKWQLLVDGQYVTLPDVPSEGGGRRCLIDFGSVVTGKRLRLEHMGGGQLGVIEIRTESTATCTAPTASTQRLVFFSDSFGEGSGATSQRQALAYRVCKELGFSDYRIAASGATGLLQDQAGTRINGFDRWTADVVTPAPTLVICFIGINDMNDGNDATIQTTFATKLNELRAAHPGCLVHVIGPPNVSAPTLPLGYAGIAGALQAASANRTRTWFHSMADVAYTKADATHPDDAGHDTLYKAIYNRIAAVHGLRRVA